MAGEGQPATSKGVISMSQLGRMGRFGNMIFQYMFLKTYCRRHGLDLQIPPWPGNRLFGTQDPPVTRKLTVLREKDKEDADEGVIPHTHPPFINCDFRGWFQYHTSYYRPDRDYIRSLFQPVPQLAEALQTDWTDANPANRPLIGIHIRRGDYGKDRQGYFWRTPVRWFIEKLWELRARPELESSLVYIATEEPVLVRRFLHFPQLSTNLFIHSRQVVPTDLQHYLDFWALTQCDYLLIPNSTFSFAAAMLNTRLQTAWRSVLSIQGWREFDPWNDKPLNQKERIEDYLHIYGILQNQD